MGAQSARDLDGRSAELTYEAIASVYDAYTSFNDYEGWIDELLPILERRDLRGRRLLDVGCGTGKSFLPMLPRGWQVTGCDISASMLELARAKVGEGVRLSVADMRDLPVLGEFDLVWSLDDAVNYMLDENELTRALRGMAANLAPTGLLLFDVNALYGYRSFWAMTEAFAELADGRQVVWHGEASAVAEPGSLCEARMTIEAPEAPFGEDASEELATHRQRHFPEHEVLTALERAGLECLDVYGQSTDGIPRKPLDEGTHTKAIYIATAS